MDKQTRDALRQLHKQLQDIDSVSETDRQLAERLRNDIQALLNRGKNEAPGSESVIEQLQEGVQRFEVSHPDLTAVMSGVIKSLSDSGI
jgi:hypothetical protein